MVYVGFLAMRLIDKANIKENFMNYMDAALNDYSLYI